MRPILLIGPREDPVLFHFKNYAKTNNITVYHWSDLSDMQFSMGMDMELGGNVQFAPSINDVPLREFSIFLHRAYELFPYVHNQDERFRINEFFAALWSLCALNPQPVINRPGLLEWQFDKILRKTSLRLHRVANLYLSNSSEVLSAWEKQAPGRELHIENRLTGSRVIFSNKEPLEDWLSEQQSSHFRMVFPTNSDYMIYLVVGDWDTVLLNETDGSPDAPECKALLREIQDNLATHDISFYAVILTYIEGSLKILQIETDPPFEWYKDIQEDVHFYLSQHLQSTQKQGGLK